ncbi:MAG: tRNA preQ1(34) S-adenosylmethionine ribosyltransferase-isomerase QueA [Spirochaetia bacterium]|nr:tRNA preQ1(34) S-adenosylmethionine ribosyltransferase-isomerase QueA [Spirochaetia bacterium]
MKENYCRDDFYFDLPGELVAQYPSADRDSSRLLLLDRKTGGMRGALFHDITGEIRQGDILVFNNAKVIRARIFCRRETGGAAEIVLTQRLGEHNWFIISDRTKRLKIGETISAAKDPSVLLKIIRRHGEFLEAETNIPLTGEILDSVGEIPLPPYIKRAPLGSDAGRYQTVYASQSGAVAAPTAGLHFTPELMERVRQKAETVFLTLHVSWGTFMPIRENDLSLHKMHAERYILPDDAAAKINRARKDGRRVIAVGTTSLRVLEAAFSGGKNIPGEGETDIFIRPPLPVKSIDALITNFHTPCSTLLMLVSAFAGCGLIMEAYKKAVEERYRFFSYGDAMFIS